MLELSTYTASFQVMLFAKPLAQILPGFPDKRLLPLLTLERPSLPGQRLLSGFTIAPQLGLARMLVGSRHLAGARPAGRPVESRHAYTPALAVTVAHGSREGTLYCEPAKTKLDRVRQIGGITTRMAFSFLPFNPAARA